MSDCALRFPDNTAVVVLAAGIGSRMKSRRPKVLHHLAGRPLLRHLLATLEDLAPTAITVVVGPDMAAVAEVAQPHATVVQQERLGTAHAVLAARRHLSGFETLVIAYGDTPLLSAETMVKLATQQRRQPRPAAVALGFCPAQGGAYGRLVGSAEGRLERIVEFADATEEERALTLCNSGILALDGGRAVALLEAIGNDNAKGEFYLTDIIAEARRADLPCAWIAGDEAELLGINSRAELATAEQVVQQDLRQRALEGGATLVDPSSVHFSWDTQLGRDVVVAPHVVFGPGVVVEDDVEIRAFCHLEGAHIKQGSVVGPFARLRPGAVVGPRGHIGNFVEIKNAVVEDGAKVNHLTYVGDAQIGAGANIGAGTITCNYDGFLKSRTVVGAGAFIGSNTSLVAPVEIGAGAIVGAGSTITADVPADAIAVERAESRVHKGAARRFRAARQAEKARRQTGGS